MVIEKRRKETLTSTILYLKSLRREKLEPVIMFLERRLVSLLREEEEARRATWYSASRALSNKQK